MHSNKKKKNNKLKIAIIILFIFAVIVGGGLWFFYNKFGGLPTDGQIISGEDLQGFIDEQEKNGIQVEIVD